MIEKPAIFVTSIGRTGTKFFAYLFRNIIADATSLHEPDVFTIGPHTKIIDQVREAGPYNLFVRKLLGQWSVIELSDARVSGKLSHSEAVRKLLQQRETFVASKPGNVYVESSLGYYGLLDVLQDVCRRARIAYVVRDGRAWVRSFMNRGAGKLAPTYAKGKVMSRLTHTWPTPFDIQDETYMQRWASMNRFERLCWAWARLNSYALETLEQSSNVKLFYFESIFESKDRHETFREFVNFLTSLIPSTQVCLDSAARWLDRQVNSSANDFPAWQQWTIQQKEYFETTCGPLMRQLGYNY